MIRTFANAWLSLLLLGLMAGCATVTPQDYARESPKLDLKTYFNGKVDGWGMVQDRSGKVLRRMVVEMECTWNGEEGVLDESFRWSDGKTEKRVWKIRKQGDRYIGTAGDVVGEALGETAGNALRWRYVLALDVDGKTINVDFDDWMFLVDDQVMLNRSLMSKYGFALGEVTLSLKRRTP